MLVGSIISILKHTQEGLLLSSSPCLIVLLLFSCMRFFQHITKIFQPQALCCPFIPSSLSTSYTSLETSPFTPISMIASRHILFASVWRLSHCILPPWKCSAPWSLIQTGLVTWSVIYVESTESALIFWNFRWLGYITQPCQSNASFLFICTIYMNERFAAYLNYICVCVCAQFWGSRRYWQIYIHHLKSSMEISKAGVYQP